MTRNELIGTALAIGAMVLVAWLSFDNWKISECKRVLLTSEFEHQEVNTEIANPEFIALKQRLETDSLTQKEAACVAKIGSPMK